MANKPRDQVRREMDVIRPLLDTLSDDEIIAQQRISQATFYRYKKRIRKQFAKAWEKQNTDRALYTYAKFNTTLEYCYRETMKIINDPDTKQSDRIEAIKTLDTISSQIARLARDGPVFTPSLPNKVVEVEGREVQV